MRTTVLIGRDQGHLVEVTFLVDSGSFYTILSPAIARQLGVITTLTAPAVLADKRVVQLPLGMAYLRINGREGGVPVGILDVPEPLLGVTALEALGYKIDPVQERLEEVRPFGPAIL